jgi:hypothetical protein
MKLSDPVVYITELKHGTIKGIVRHVDGLGQCLIDSINQLKCTNKRAKMVRNEILQNLIRAPEQFIGRNVFKEETISPKQNACLY